MKARRKLLSGLAVGVAVVFSLAPPAGAQVNDDVTNTKHNLSISSGGNDPTSGNALEDYGEICVYCHTPHGGQVEAPLWNRNFSTATYQMYTSATLDMVADGQPTGISQACLSCHDGTIGLDVIVNAPNVFEEGGGVVPPTTSGTNTMPVGNRNLGTDLRNDHPISITYDNTVDPAFNSTASITAAGLKLFTDPTGGGLKVQCASCHNPHDDTNTPFLRIANSSSNLCLTCHIK